MANRMIAIALLSIGMIAMNKSATIWKSALNSEVLTRANPAPASRLFSVQSPAGLLFPSPELGDDFQRIQQGRFGMSIHACTDEYGVEWKYVVLKKENGTYFLGWMKAESVTPIPHSAAPTEWAQVHKSWGW